MGSSITKLLWVNYDFYQSSREADFYFDFDTFGDFDETMNRFEMNDDTTNAEMKNHAENEETHDYKVSRGKDDNINIIEEQHEKIENNENNSISEEERKLQQNDNVTIVEDLEQKNNDNEIQIEKKEVVTEEKIENNGNSDTVVNSSENKVNNKEEDDEEENKENKERNEDFEEKPKYIIETPKISELDEIDLKPLSKSKKKANEEVEDEDVEVDNRSPREILREHIEENKWKQEWIVLSKELSLVDIDQCTINAKMVENKNKSNYSQFFTFDNTRVHLSKKYDKKGKEKAGSDYVNASHIYLPQAPCNYIAAGAPSEDSIEDFWRMIWENDTKYIIMLTKLVENNRMKSAQYWPSPISFNSDDDDDDDDLFDFTDDDDFVLAESVYGNFTVQLKFQKAGEFHPDITQRNFRVLKDACKYANENECEKKDVIQFHYSGWPDHGVPKNIEGVCTLIQNVIDFIEKKKDDANNTQEDNKNDDNNNSNNNDNSNNDNSDSSDSDSDDFNKSDEDDDSKNSDDLDNSNEKKNKNNNSSISDGEDINNSINSSLDSDDKNDDDNTEDRPIPNEINPYMPNGEKGKSPIVVHCSAGIGRTGTFLVIHSELCKYLRGKKEYSLDIFETVRRLRSQRYFMIQTEDQYLFCYKSLLRLIEENSE